MKTYDNRFKRLSGDPKLVLINNYKCGFSSSNLLAHHRVTSIEPEDTVVLFYRNVFLRAISVFINWCITDDRYLHHQGWLLRNLRDRLNESEYDCLIGLLHAGEHVGAFTYYVERLEQIFAMNNHTLPQVAIFDYYGYNKIDHFIELENNAAFQDLTGIEFPCEQDNISDQETKQALTQCLRDSEGLRDELSRIYGKDIEFFQGHGIDVASTAALV